MRFRESAPLPANPRMENLFERAFPGRALKHYRPKGGPIQVSRVGKNFGTELTPQLLFDFLKIDKLMGGLISIEKFGAGNDLTQAFTETGLTCGNPARDADGWHLMVIDCSTLRHDYAMVRLSWRVARGSIIFAASKSLDPARRETQR